MRVQQNGRKNQTDFGLLYPPSPRPSGRSPHRSLIFFWPPETPFPWLGTRRPGWGWVLLNADDAGARAMLAGSLGQPRILLRTTEGSFDWRLRSGLFAGGRWK